MFIDTTRGFILLATAATIVLLGAIVRTKSPTAGSTLARLFLVACVGLGCAVIAATALLASGLIHITGVGALLFRIAIYRAWIATGGAVATASLLLLRRSGPEGLRRILTGESIQSFLDSPKVSNGLAYSAALAYVAVEAGKLTHDAEMRMFFTQSGFPFWTNYVVMAAEITGAIGLTVHKTRIVAALGLSILMTGAIGTHYHNGDPFSDSLEAVNLLVILVCLVAILTLRESRLTPNAPLSRPD